jgi:hypothetical protein
MIDRMKRDLSQDEALQILIEKLRGTRIPCAFGEKLAEEVVEKYFPKW